MVKNNYNHSRGSFWPKLLIGGGVVLLVAAATVAALAFLRPKAITNNIQTSSSMLDNFSKQEGPVLSKAGYQKVATTYTSYMLYDDSRQYGLYLPINSGQYVKYQTKDQSTNDAKQTSGLVSFIKKLGLAQISTTSLSGITQNLFVNDKIACQLSDINEAGNQPAAYVLSCLDKSAIDKQYANIDSLLAKAQSDVNSSTIKAISYQLINDGGNQLSILTTTNKDKSSLTLYFVNSAQDWNYLGSRPTPSVDNQSSFTIPTRLRQSIDSSPQKAFLDKYIQ